MEALKENAPEILVKKNRPAGRQMRLFTMVVDQGAQCDYVLGTTQSQIPGFEDDAKSSPQA